MGRWRAVAIVGPGSEWFWAAAQFFIVAVTLLGLYRQLRAQNAANALLRMEALQGRWQSATIVHARLAVATWLRDHPGENLDYDGQVVVALLADYFENLSDLEEEGYLTWKEIENTWGLSLALYWRLLEELVRVERRRTSALAYAGFERLATRAELRAFERGDSWTGRGRDEVLADLIERNTARLRLLTAIEAGVPSVNRESPRADQRRRGRVTTSGEK